MITVIRTNDGRLLVTDRKNIKKVIKEAKEDLVELGELEESIEIQSDRSYVLIETEFKVGEACRPNLHIVQKP